MERTETAEWREWRRTRDSDLFRGMVGPELGRAVAVARGAGCDPAAAEDAVQEALVALACENTDEPVACGLRTWLLRAVRDRARSSLRSDRRRRQRERSAARSDAQLPAASELEATEAVESALASLAAEDQEAVRLRYVLDLDYREVAAVLSISEGAARVRVHRAIERLRARFGAHATALLAAIPLPLVARSDALLAHAVAKASSIAAAGAASAAGAQVAGAAGATGSLVTGGAVMATAKILTAGVVGLILGTGATLGVTLSVGAPVSPDSRVAPGSGERTSAAGSPRRNSGRAVARTDQQAVDPLAALDASAEERTWLHTALLAERDRRTRAAILPSDTGADVLRRYFDSGADVGPVLASFEAARTHVRTEASTPRRFEASDEITKPDLDAVRGATVIEFGPGTFELSKATRWMDRRDAVSSLEVRGAGMDRTKLILPGRDNFMFVGDAAHVVFRDLTFTGPENPGSVFSLRGGFSAAFERVRFSVGVKEAGSGSVFTGQGSAFLACKDCEFLGGADAAVWVTSGSSLAVFDGCLFSDFRAFVIGWGMQHEPRSTVSLRNCRFVSTALADSRVLVARTGRPEVRLVVRGGSAEIGAARGDDAARRERWGARFAESVEGMSYAAAPPRLTVAEALQVIAFAESRGWHCIVYAKLMDLPRDRPRRVILEVATEASRVQHVVELRDDGPQDVGTTNTSTTSLRASDVAGLLPLRALLAGCPGLESEEIRVLQFQQLPSASAPNRWALRIETADRVHNRFVDAASGSPIDGY